MRKQFGGHDEKPCVSGGAAIEVLGRPRAAAQRRGRRLRRRAAAGGGRRPRPFSFAVSGGHTPWAMFARAGRRGRCRGAQSRFYQVDERVAPAGDPDRNLTHLLDSLPAEPTARCSPMPVERRRPRRGCRALRGRAARRASTSSTSASGPTATPPRWCPGDPVLDVTDRDVALTGDYQGRRRMTLTYPVLNRRAQVLWLVTGADKVEALASCAPATARSRPAGSRRAR